MSSFALLLYTEKVFLPHQEDTLSLSLQQMPLAEQHDFCGFFPGIQLGHWMQNPSRHKDTSVDKYTT